MMSAIDERDLVPTQVSMMSPALGSRMADVGLGCCKSILEHHGVFTFSCLGRLSDEELVETCQHLRAAGFGPGHARSLRELCKQCRMEMQSAPNLDVKGDATPVLNKLVSPKLHAQLDRKGLQRMQPILGQSGVQSAKCLAKLSNQDFEEIVSAVRAAGFDQNSVQALRELQKEVQSEASDDMKPVASSPVPALALTGLESPPKSPSAWTPPSQDGENGLLRMASPRRTRRGREAMEAAMEKDMRDFDLVGRPTKIMRITDSPCAPLEESNSMAALNKVSADFVSMLQNITVQSAAAPWKPELQNALLAVQGFKKALSEKDVKKEQLEPQLAVKQLSHKEPGSACKRESNLDVKPVGLRPKREIKEESVDQDLESPSRMFENRAADLYGRKTRISRHEVMDIIAHTRALQTEVVKYRDRATGTLLEARIPVTVTSLLQLHASCSGKEVTEQRLARMAMDVMEENQYDPVRAVAALSPGSILCPTTAMQVLGSGFIGIVFLEEESGEVVKVMLEDFAKREYEVFSVFANAGVAPRPLSITGPIATPGGGLHSIRMEMVRYNLHQVMWNKAPKGPRHGLSPPSESVINRIGTKLVATLQALWDNGLVHGDLHLFNVGLCDKEAQEPMFLVDFGRSSFSAGADDCTTVDAFRAGHEYDIYRLVGELCGSFDELVEEYQATKKECEKELRELRKTQEVKKVGEPEAEHAMHQSRLIVGLQEFLAEEPKALEQVELAFSTILGAVIKYGSTKFDFPYEGVPCVRSRRMRQAAMRRQKAGYAVYFKSNLFWGGTAS